MSTKNSKLQVRWTVAGREYCEVFTSKRAMIERVKDTFKEADLSTAQDAVKAIKVIHAKVKAMGHVWQDQTPKKTTKRASRASGRRHEHHARNELAKNLEKSSGAPRGGEAIEIALAKDLKKETRKAAKARRVARKIMPQVQEAVEKSFTAPADKAAQIASFRKAKHLKSEVVEVLGDLEDKVAGVISYGTEAVAYMKLHVTLINEREFAFRCESPVELAPIVENAAAKFAEAERKAKAKRKADREANEKAVAEAIAKAIEDAKGMTEFEEEFALLLAQEAAENAASEESNVVEAGE